MAYATQADIEKQYSADAVLLVAEDPDNVGQVDTEKVTDNLLSADGVIDGYAEKAGYAVPIAPVPNIVREMVVDIALYRMSTEATLTDEKRQRYEDAIAFLKDVAKGLASLPGVPVAAPPEAPAGTRVPGRVSGGDRQFTRDTQAGTR